MMHFNGVGWIKYNNEYFSLLGSEINCNCNSNTPIIKPYGEATFALARTEDSKTLEEFKKIPQPSIYPDQLLMCHNKTMYVFTNICFKELLMNPSNFSLDLRMNFKHLRRYIQKENGEWMDSLSL